MYNNEVGFKRTEPPMKDEDGIASDVDAYVASPPGKSEMIGIAAISFNNSKFAVPFGRELQSELTRLTQVNGPSELMTDVHGAFISFVMPWPEEAVNTLFTDIARKLNVSVSIDQVSRSVASKLRQHRR